MASPSGPIWGRCRALRERFWSALGGIRPWSDWRRHPPAEFDGRVMGTHYVLTLVRRPAGLDPQELHQAAAGALHRVEALMSTYRAESEVSRINAAGHSAWIPVSSETVRVIHQALEVARWTGGAYDITVGPLVNLWGFGAQGPAGEVPSDAAVAEARARVGFDRLEARLKPPAVRKLDPRVQIDLAGIAKGYGVDAAAQALDGLRVRDYCLEVGGEIRTRGRNPLGRTWQVAIESPEPAGPGVLRVLALSNRAVATSGDYRIFVEQAGTRYSHAIDPRTGYPVQNGVVSVTVVSKSCAQADAWATALMVAGPETALPWASRHHLAALLLVQTSGQLVEHRTPLFDRCG